MIVETTIEIKIMNKLDDVILIYDPVQNENIRLESLWFNY